jgi:hypothetical protein
MKTLSVIGKESEESKQYNIRLASRGIVFDTDNKIAILHASKNNITNYLEAGLKVMRANRKH